MNHLREFFTLAPSTNDHHPAIRCAIGTGAPLLVLLALGRTDLSLFAVIGAFTGAYGRGLAHRRRLSHQWRAGMLLTTCVALGLLVSHLNLPQELIIACTSVVAALGLLATRFNRLQPDGSLFLVFAFSAVAFLPATLSPWLAMGTSITSVLLSMSIGVGGRALPGHHTPWVNVMPAPLTPADQERAYLEAALHVAAVAFSGIAAVRLGWGHSYWAMIAASASLVGASATHRVVRGLHRILGAFGGLMITSFLLGLHLPAWQTVMVVIVLKFLVELFVTRHYALAQVFVTPLALLMTEVAMPTSPWQLMLTRGVETLIGAGTGMFLVVILHSLRVERSSE